MAQAAHRTPPVRTEINHTLWWWAWSFRKN